MTEGDARESVRVGVMGACVSVYKPDTLKLGYVVPTYRYDRVLTHSLTHTHTLTHSLTHSLTGVWPLGWCEVHPAFITLTE